MTIMQLYYMCANISNATRFRVYADNDYGEHRCLFSGKYALMSESMKELRVTGFDLDLDQTGVIVTVEA